MKKGKYLIAGVAIGMFARPIVQVLCGPLNTIVRNKLYNIALDFIQNTDAKHNDK